jgi:cytochrome c-type biogenesis protein CcmE
MTPRRKKRLLLVLALVVGVGSAVALALSAFRENLLYFYSPSQVLAGEAPSNHHIRLGGLVQNGSVARQADGLTVHFALTDTVETVTVTYTGILPDLFREGQGIVATGRLNGQGVFEADQVLAKHDENYMPPEVADALDTARAEESGPGKAGRASKREGRPK